MDLSSEGETSSLVDKEDLFSSEDPALNELLGGATETKQKRRRCKSKDKNIPKLDLGMSLEGLTEASALIEH